MKKRTATSGRRGLCVLVQDARECVVGELREQRKGECAVIRPSHWIGSAARVQFVDIRVVIVLLVRFLSVVLHAESVWLVVQLHVLGEMVGLCEGTKTQLALKANLAVVSALVDLETIFARERSGAHVACKRFFASVHA